MSHALPETSDRSLETWNSGGLGSQLGRAQGCNLRFPNNSLNSTTLPGQTNLYVWRNHHQMFPGFVLLQLNVILKFIWRKLFRSVHLPHGY